MQVEIPTLGLPRKANIFGGIVLRTLVVFIFALLAGPGIAADVSKVDHPVCDYRLEGPIEDGDAAQMEPLRGTYDGITLCLNSPGGSLIEGRKVFDEIWAGNIKTRVLSGDRCESACALAFLGGSINTGSANIRFQERVIEPGARLGFHAPSLNLPSGGTYPAQLVNSTFETALKSAEDIFAMNLHEEHGVVAMNNFLYQRILTTRPDDMYYITSVGDAVMANIDLSGVDLPVTPKLENLTALCDNYWAANRQAARPNYSSAAEYFTEIRKGIYGTRNPVEVEQRGQYAAKVNDYFSAAKFMEFSCIAAINEDFRRGSSDVWLRIYRHWSEGETPEDLAEAAEVSVPIWYMLDPQTPIAAFVEGGASASDVATDNFVKFAGIDLFGGDLDDGTVRTNSKDSCIQACAERDDCDAVTMDRWNGYCYLKSVSQSRQTLYVLSKATTWIKAPMDQEVYKARRGVIKHWSREDKGFPGNPFAAKPAESLKACMRLCYSYECQGVNWRQAQGQCELFEEPAAYSDAIGVVAGFRQQEILDQ